MQKSKLNFPIFFILAPTDNPAPPNGTTIHQWSFHGCATSRWELDLTSDGYYTIRSMFSGTTDYYLAVENDSEVDGASIVLKSGPLTDGMKWNIAISDCGSATIISAIGDEHYLSVEDSPSPSNVGLDLVSATYCLGIKWYLRNLDDTIEDDLLNWGLISSDDIVSTDDGFHMILEPLANIMTYFGVTETRYLDNGDVFVLNVDKYYDDWYFFALSQRSGIKYSLVKMREDISPQVTVPFVSLDVNAFFEHLHSSTEEDLYQLYPILTKVTGPGCPDYDDVLQSYFVDASSKGAYLIAEEYVKMLARMSQGTIPFPSTYQELLQKIEEETIYLNLLSPTDDNYNSQRGKVLRLQRIPNALNRLNEQAGKTIYDSDAECIIIEDVDNLTIYEKQAILVMHTANETFNSFAAEVAFHADFLEWSFLGIKVYDWIPIYGSIAEERALRADMAVGEEEESGYLDDYYDVDSDVVQAQVAVHGGY